LWYQLDAVWQLFLIAIGGLLTAILFTKLGWRTEFRRLFPSSLRVNLLVYVFDALLVSIPLATLVGLIYSKLSSNGLVLFSKVFDDAPAWLVAIACLWTSDFIGYWRHRFEHSALLWPAHSLHHSDEEMTWFTLFRFHPLNRVSTAVIDYGSLFAIGFPLWAIGLAGTARYFYGMFVHINRPWTLGPLGRLLVSPAMHRWHHVQEGRGMYSNYASIFSMFDRVFGTFYVPGPCYEKLGVEGINHTEYVSQMMLPLQGLLKKFRVNLFNRSSRLEKR
jgi:sterol desaturase/sphingolipid hydroxylase (fatty acid hydroxylase superfamily)